MTGFAADAVAASFTKAFRISDEQAKRLLGSAGVVLKRGLSAADAARFAERVQELGCNCSVVAEGSVTSVNAMPPAPPGQGSSKGGDAAAELRYGRLGSSLWWLVAAVFCVLLLAGVGNKAPIVIAIALLAVVLLNPIGQRKAASRIGLGTRKRIFCLAVVLAVGSISGMGYSIDPEVTARQERQAAERKQANLQEQNAKAEADARKESEKEKAKAAAVAKPTAEKAVPTPSVSYAASSSKSSPQDVIRLSARILYAVNARGGNVGDMCASQVRHMEELESMNMVSDPYRWHGVARSCAQEAFSACSLWGNESTAESCQKLRAMQM
jgi:hypothetical protein